MGRAQKAHAWQTSISHKKSGCGPRRLTPLSTLLIQEGSAMSICLALWVADFGSRRCSSSSTSSTSPASRILKTHYELQQLSMSILAHTWVAGVLAVSRITNSFDGTPLCAHNHGKAIRLVLVLGSCFGWGLRLDFRGAANQILQTNTVKMLLLKP